MTTPNRTHLRLVGALDDVAPIEDPEPEPLAESYTPRYSTRRYLIVLAIIVIWCALLALAAYSPAK